MCEYCLCFITSIVYCRLDAHRYTRQPMLVLVTAWPHYWGMEVTWQLKVAPTCLLWTSSSPMSHALYTSSQIFSMAASSPMVPLLMIVVSRYLFELVPYVNIFQLCEFWGLCSSVTEDLGLLACDAAPLDEQLLMIQRQYNLVKCLKQTVHWQSVIYLKTSIFWSVVYLHLSTLWTYT